MFRIILLCITLAFAMEAPPAVDNGAPPAAVDNGKGKGKGSPAKMALLKEMENEAESHKHPRVDGFVAEKAKTAGKDRVEAVMEEMAGRIIAGSNKEPVQALDEAADDAEKVFAEAENDPYLQAVVDQILKFETEPTHPATHKWAQRTAEELGTYPEKVIVMAAMAHKADVMKAYSERAAEAEGPQDLDFGDAVADYLEELLVESEKDPLAMAAVDVATKEIFNPTHPLLTAKLAAEAKQDGEPVEVKFVKTVMEQKEPLKEDMEKKGITDLTEGLESAVGDLEAQAAAAALAAEVAMEEADAEAYRSYSASRPLTALDYGTYFFAAIGVAFLAGKGFMMLKSPEYAVVEHDDSL